MEGSEFSPDSLKAAGVLKKLEKGFKVLGTGEITRAIKVIAHQCSEGAKAKIEAAGGSVEIIPPFIPAPIKNPKRDAALVRKAAKKK